MANNRELSQFGSLVEVSNEATSIKVGLAGASVGIGTTNPTEKLEVHGNIKIVDGSINVASASSFTEQTTFEAGVGIADSIFHIGDVDTQIRFPAADIVSVETGGSERLRVESGGGIGIGDSIYHLSDTNTQVRFPAADTFTVETGGAERFRIGSNGYASIGKGTQGDELLHVGSSSTISPAIKVENDQGSLIIGRRQTSRFGIGTEGHVIQSDGDDFAIGTSDGEDFTIGTNNEKRITVKDNGRVGIGTDDPDELLEVLGKAKVIDLVASNLSVSSGIGTFQDLKVTGDLTVEGTTTTLDTNLIGVDRVEVGANSNSIVAIAVTQSGKADILNFFNGAGTEVLGITTDGNITIQNADAGSSAGPEFKLFRNSASPADADYLGQIKFAGESDTGVERNYAKITGKILDASNGTEDGIIEFAHIKAGSQTITGRWRSDSLQLLNDTAFSVAGDITANGNIQGDGNTNITSINDITAGGVLTVDGVSDLDELTVTGVSTFSANVNLGDNDKLQIGNGTDLRLYHNETNSYIENYTGNLYIFNASNDKDVLIQTDNGSGGTTNYIVCDGSEGSVILSHYGAQKFATTGLGATVTGNLGVRTDLTVGNVLTVDGVSDLDELVVTGVSTLTTLRMSINNAVGITSIVDEDDMASNSDTALATQQSIKAYVATQISAEDLDVTTDSGTIAIDLDSETLSISGTSNEIETSATGNAVTIGLPNNVTIGGELDVTTLDVSGNADIDGLTNLDEVIVAGVSTFSSDLSIADKIVHTGDTNTAIRFPAADTFTVETGGTERIRITSGGSVGIGNTASSNIKLDVEGSLRAKAAAYAAPTNGTGLEIYYATGTLNDAPSGYLLSYDRDASAYKKINYDASDHKFRTSGTERLRITSGGSVGIGTDNPVGNLEVRDTKANLIVAKDGLTVKSNSNLHTTYDMLQIGAGGALASYSVETVTADTQLIHNAYRHSGGNFKYRYADSAARIMMNSPGGTFRFENAASGSADGDITFSERLRITSDGDVGINTTAPQNGAHFQHFQSLARHQSFQSTNGDLAIVTDNNSNPALYIKGTGTADLVNIFDNTTEVFTIKDGGNVGIKTTAPNNNLTVGDGVQTSYAPSTAGNYIEIARTSGADAGLLINKNTGQWLVGIDNSDGANAPLRFEYGAAGSAHPGFGAGALGMIIKHNGKIAIGTDNPLVQLDIRSTDAIKVPVGTTGERPTGAAGYIRYNSSIASYEGHNGSEWAGIGGAAEVETTVSSTSATTCESFAKTSYRSASIIAQITQGSSYQVGNYLLIHDGTTVTVVEESAVATGDMLGSFTASISGSNVVFQVNMASASSATVTTKMTKVSIP